MKKPTPPTGLSAEARAWFRKLTSEYGISDPGGLLILRTGMEALDRLRGCQASIKAEGAAVKDRWGQVKPHPLLAAERDARAQLLAALKQLNLDVEPLHDGPGRPPGR